MRDEGIRGRQDYLSTFGWKWGFTGPVPVRKVPKRKLLLSNEDMFMRPTITVYGGNEG